MNKKVSTLVAALMAAGALVLPKDVFAQVAYANGKNFNSVTAETQVQDGQNYFLVFNEDGVDYVAVVEDGSLKSKKFEDADFATDFLEISQNGSYHYVKTQGSVLSIGNSYPEVITIDLSKGVNINAGTTAIKKENVTFSEIQDKQYVNTDLKFISIDKLCRDRYDIVYDNILSTSVGYTLRIGQYNVLGGQPDGTALSESYNKESLSQVWYVEFDEVEEIAKFRNAETGKFLLVDGGKEYVKVKIKEFSKDKWGVENPNALEYVGSANVAGQDISVDKLGLGIVQPEWLSAQDLNDVNRGSFSLTYKFSDSEPATVNAFDRELKAFSYNSNMYLATAWPESANEKDYLTDAEFKVSEFIVADPNDNWNIKAHDEFGESAKFVVKRGDALQANVNAGQLKAGKYAIENAQFQVYKSVNTDGYVLQLNTVKGLNDKKDAVVASYTVEVALVDDQQGRLVTTVMSYFGEEDGELKKGASITNKRSVAVKDFLSTESAKVFNIKFVSKNEAATGLTEKEKATKSEYNKYLAINGDATSLLAHGSDFANLNAPENQWIVTNANPDAKTFTFTNREDGQTSFTVELISTDIDNVYELRSGSEVNVDYAYVDEDGKYNRVDKNFSLNGKKVALEAVTPDTEAGYVSTYLDNAGLTRIMFSSEQNTVAADVFVTAVQKSNETISNVNVNKDEDLAAQFSIVKFDDARTSTALSDTIYAYNNYVIWDTANNTTKVITDGDTIAVVSYAFKQLRADGKDFYLTDNAGQWKVEEVEKVADAPRFIVKENKNGSYSLIKATSGYFRNNVNVSAQTYDVATSSSTVTPSKGIYYNYAKETYTMHFLKETPGTSFNHVPQHVTMESVNGGYIAMNAENNNGIIAPVPTLKADYTKEDLTFWLDTTDSEAVTPSFMISKAGNYMYNATDSLNRYNGGTASEEKVKEFALNVNGADLPRVIFQSADLTKVEDIENYKFQIVQSPESEEEYIIKSLNGYNYVAAHNQQLYISTKVDAALRLIVTPAEAPTSNEGVSTTEVKVVANNGSINVKNAAGKNVVVSTILGQVVANEVLTSDNATINVPAGIVVVAVEGESFKVNVK